MPKRFSNKGAGANALTPFYCIKTKKKGEKMLQTKTISKEAVAVATEPTEILLRRHGKKEFGHEKKLCFISGDGKTLQINKAVAEAFGLSIEIQKEEENL